MMPKTLIKIGSQDHGRRITLGEFERAEAQEGYCYELAKGVVAVVEVPGKRHLAQITALRRQLSAYDLAYPGRIHTLAAGSECKILLIDLESERHPDLAIYQTTPPESEDMWSLWIPEIVVEVVSPGSEQRDYVEKREEYLRFGVKEYWIIDAQKPQILVLQRSRGQWMEQIITATQTYRTHLLPGFELNSAGIFQV